MRFIITIGVCLVSAAGAVDNGFPDDPAGVEIIDRAYYRDPYVQDGVHHYFRLFNDGDQGTVELFSGTSNGQEYIWDCVYTWQPKLYTDKPFAFLPVCVISLQPGNSSLLVTWIQRLFTESHEGIGSLYLEYNLESGVIDEFWID
ncbi:MAG: hypothetical protein KAR44_01615 [Candidatus Aegiribacteria sp.]|nr:hypothetical protein [Candidatus Aegiribacteria sp.]